MFVVPPFIWFNQAVVAGYILYVYACEVLSR